MFNQADTSGAVMQHAQHLRTGVHGHYPRTVVPYTTPVRLHFGTEVVVALPEIKVITHPEPLFLLGADVLCGGRKGWNFRSVGVGSDGQGFLTFAFREDDDNKGKDRRTCTVPLLNAPHAGKAPNYAPPEPTALPTAGAT